MRHTLILASLAGLACGQVQHGTLDVVENDGDNTPASVTVTRSGGDGPWAVVPEGCNRGDYELDFFMGDDALMGIMITSVNQLDRSEASVTFDPYFVTTSSAVNGNNDYFIAVHECPTGLEANFDSSFCYFPIADGWLGGNAYNAANNGPMVTWVGNPSVTIRDEFSFTGIGNEFVDDTATAGLYLVSIEGLDMRRDGVIITSGAKNEDNRTAVDCLFDGTAVINCIDNASEGGGENDHAGFVFIPDGTEGVTMGRVTYTGKVLYSQGDATVEMVDQPLTNGTFRITIPGESAATGTMFVIPHTELGGTTIDNPIFVEPSGNSWIIETRDIEPTGLTLQDVGSGDVLFHYAFFKNGVNITPGTPSQDYVDRLDDIISANIVVTEITPDNGAGDMDATVGFGSDGIKVAGLNRGDITMAHFNARHPARFDNGLDTLTGMWLGCPSEFVRDNSTTGGISGWSTFSFDNGDARSHNASFAGGEINANFAVAFIPDSIGLMLGADLIADNGLDTIDVGADAQSSGVLSAINWDNNNRVCTVTPNGTAFDLTTYEAEGGTNAFASVEYGFVYFEYAAFENLVAGYVDENGTTMSGNGTFTTGSGFDDFGFPITTISIPGVDARTDGILLLNALNGPWAMAFEAGPNGEFEVAGFDCATENIDQTAFSFVYIPSEGLTLATGCAADWNGDTSLDIFDIIAFLGDFDAGDSATDVNGDTVLDIFDVIGFLGIFDAGC
ncbi:MAG: hypothetical protein KDB69_05240 [Acidimicrobiia bacterium]|nr:hypothetical protein [Acidimicrobiia bacterium]